MQTKLKTVFFGSGPVALKSLKLLTDSFELQAIITKPATKPEMERHFPSIQVYAVENKAALDELIETAHFESNFGILIDFGIIVSESVIQSFPQGIINSHFSLLPEWRGADPITFAILSGQPQTGVSLMLLSPGMDTGPLLAQSVYEIPRGCTTPELTDTLVELSDEMIKHIVPDYAAGKMIAQPQETSSILGEVEPTYSRKLTKADGLIDWRKPAATLEREIRAFIEWPHSYATLAGIELIVTAAHLANESLPAGHLMATKQRLVVGCGEGALELDRIKPAGKKEMAAAAFLAGYGQRLIAKG